jgi:hypothetical protein
VFDFDFERKREMGVLKRVLVFGVVITMVMVMRVASHDYGDALTKSILFFEGQRSGKLPPTQRMTWRKDSGLQDGFQIGVSLVLCVCVCVNASSLIYHFIFISVTIAIAIAIALFWATVVQKKSQHLFSRIATCNMLSHL